MSLTQSLRRAFQGIGLFTIGSLFGVIVTVGVEHLGGSFLQPGAHTRTGPSQSARRALLTLNAEDRYLGRRDAPLTIVEFSDYQCPYCRRFNSETLPQLKQHYIETGKLRFVHRDLPLPGHAQARSAAEAALCAAEEGKYWEMRETLLDRSQCLACSDVGVTGIAKAVVADQSKFEACTQSRRYAGRVDRDVASAAALGIAATPSFVIGKTTAGGVDGAVIEGAQPYEAFREELDRLLK